MALAAWFREVSQGELSTELLDLRLESSRFDPFAGQGFLRWTSDTGIQISAITNGGQPLVRNSFGHMETALGSLISPSDHLRLTATTRDSDVITIGRLRFDGYSAHSGHEAVVWSIDRSLVASTVDFTRGLVGDEAQSISLLLSNGGGIVWPRISPDGQSCLQCQTAIGQVTAFAEAGEKVLIRIDAPTPQKLSRLIEAVGYAFCFWAGKILPLIACEGGLGDSVCLRLYPLHKLSTSRQKPPLGYSMLPSLFSFHETLLQRAVDFFANEDSHRIGQLVHARLSCADAPFSAGVLILCAALEGLARVVSKTATVGEEIDASTCARVENCFLQCGLPSEMVGRFRSFASKVNAKTAANAISDWCRSGFLGFDAKDKRAWDFRNKSAHGNFALYGEEFEERQESVARVARLSNMFNKLVMHAIGYVGKYFDYATHEDRDFPPAARSAPDR